MNPDKVALRAEVLTRRAALSPSALAGAESAIRRLVLAAVLSAGASCVCAYVPVGTEPGSVAALHDLALAGVDVLLPVLRGDLDLDWACFERVDLLVAANRGLREPAGPRLGREAIGAVGLAIVPALAVDRHGNRLGRGGGSYDRALARVAQHVPVAALLHDGERLVAVPYDPHDRPVTHTVTPARGWQAIDDD